MIRELRDCHLKVRNNSSQVKLGASDRRGGALADVRDQASNPTEVLKRGAEF